MFGHIVAMNCIILISQVEFMVMVCDVEIEKKAYNKYKVETQNDYTYKGTNFIGINPSKCQSIAMRRELKT